MNDRQRLAVVRALHPVVFAVMVAAALTLLLAGLTGATGWWVWAAMGLLAIEGTALIANRFVCPLTEMAVRLGAREGHVLDVFISARFARVTFWLFGAVAAVGVVLVSLRWTGVIGG